MAFTQTNLDAIETTIASGELKINLDGREVIYRSVDDLLKARNVIRESLKASGAIPATPRTSYASRVRN